MRPGIAPTTRPAPADVLALDASLIKPMHREILAVDLTAALRAARAGNLDIRQARQQVEAARGRWQSDVGGALPALGVTAPFEHVDGTVRESQGSLIGVGFNTFQPAAAVQWITNPGQVIYDLIASRKRLLASGHQEQAVILEALRQTGVQFYDLALAQTRVATAHQAVAEAEELLRISRLRSRTGTGVPADEMRAEARLAERQQDLVLAVNEFYRASVALAVTLHLDPAVTLVPSVERLPQVTLVRDDLSLDDLVELAVVHRPDLKQVRRLAEGAAALRGATWWGAFGPQFQVGYQYGGITGHSNNTEEAQGIPNNLIVNPLSATGAFSTNPVVNGFIREGISRGSARLAHRGDETFGFSDQERFNAAAGWRFTLAAFGDLKAARAAEAIALLEAERQVEQVQAQVVLALESSKTQAQLVGLSQRQVAFAQEALRLSQANLQAGTMTTLDVLQAQDAVNQARLRQAEAVVRYNQAQVNLVGAIGLLDDASATKDDMLGPGRNAE
ncbi:MAG: TolC family protein [Planctomycetes bacterium]|nr:TolC family protein [Planctomycetota bacterium]